MTHELHKSLLWVERLDLHSLIIGEQVNDAQRQLCSAESMLELLRNLILTSAEEWTGPIHASGSVEAPAGSWFPV